jgi:hypothetical protein
MTWKTVSIVLGAVLCVQGWRDCHRPAPAPAPPEREACMKMISTHAWDPAPDDPQPAQANDPEPPPQPGDGPSFNGIKLPAWTAYFAPQPGEDLMSYKNRMLPLAQAAIAPQRARVARSRDDFAAIAHLDSTQKALLDSTAQGAADRIEEKLMGAFMNGDLNPSSFKPMTGVGLARDVLDIVDNANTTFTNSLREDQKAALAQHPFDFADYLLFNTKWEDALPN